MLYADKVKKNKGSTFLSLQEQKVMEEKLPAEILDEFDFLCEESGDDNYSGILLEILDI